MIRPWLATALAVSWAGAVACDPLTEPDGERRFSFDFESGLDGWQPDGTDLDDPPVAWSINRSDERAREGERSVRLALENLNDAGKIWIERVFDLDPGTTYDIEVAFGFASADFGMVNLWRIIAGASQVDPETRDDLTFQEETGNGAADDVGFVWLEKRYTFTAEADPGTGRLWIALGVWGTSEFPRTYYIDEVEVTLIPR